MSLFGAPNVAKMAAERDVKGLCKALEYGKDTGVPTSAAQALGKIGDPRAVEPLSAALNHTYEGVRWEAASALGKLGDSRAVEALIAALGDSDSDVRSEVVWVLSQIGGVRAVDSIVAALNDTDRGVRQSAAGVLGGIGGPRAVDPLVTALNDTDSGVRKMAAGALGEIGGPRAVEPLIAALNDTEEHVRREAVEALANMHDALSDASDRDRVDQALAGFERLGETAAPPEVVPAAAREPSRHAYAMVLLGESVLGDPWSDGHAASLVRQRGDQLGYPVSLLGSVDCRGPFPTDADPYVIATALQACEKLGISFESSRDQITFQPVSRTGRKVGLITIEVSPTAATEEAATPPDGERPAVDPEVERLLREQGFEPSSIPCSGCGRRMWRYPERLARSGATLFGNVCLPCKAIFCNQCIQVGGPTPCPQCGVPTGPAGRAELLQIGCAL
jgi:HEAT repeat protein